MSHSEAEDAWLTRLARAAQAGDHQALEQFVASTQRDVGRFVAHLDTPQDTDDLTQETYLRARTSIRQFAGRPAARIWLLAIARRVVADHIRSKQRRLRPAARVEDIDTDDQRRSTTAAGFEEIVEVNLMLQALDDTRREALLPTHVLGLSYEETAEVCGCALGTVRSRIARAREQLLDRGAQASHGTA